MLARYRIVRGKRRPDDPLPEGVREDTRKHTRHVLRPTPELVSALLADPEDPARQRRFQREYEALLRQRFAQERAAFDALAARAKASDVYLGCSCPSARQPDVLRCHTVLALQFMKASYPELEVRLPEPE